MGDAPAPELIRLVDVLVRTEAWLRRRGVASPRLDAELLLSHVLGMQRLQLYLSHDRPLSSAELDALRPLVARRGDREPMAWILGHQGFHDIELIVHRDVLCPRPDTETLVEATLRWIPEDADPVYVADVGSGTGAVGLAIAAARHGVRLYAIDLSEAALANTRANVAHLGLSERVAVLRGDLLDPVPTSRPIDWVVSNPPYIPSREIDALMPEVARHEPRAALDGGGDGLEVYRRLIPEAARRGRLGVLVEVGHDQAGRVADLMRRAGLAHIETHTDLGGVRRVVAGRRSAPGAA